MLTNIHTFIIPAYKDSIFLEECIKSLKQQTIQSNIYIATSTPSEFINDIAKKHAIKVLINEHGGSMYKDWNFAYQSCKTKYLTLAHQDDVYLPDYTAKCLHFAEKNKNANTLIVFTDYNELITHTKKKISLVIMVKKLLLCGFLFKNNIKSKCIKKGILSFGNTISCPTVMFNVENIGSFSFSDQFRYNLDWEAWLRLANMNGKFIYINRKLMFHRIHSESQTTIQIQDNNRIIEEERIFTLIWNKTIARLLMKFYRYGSKLNAKTSD